MAKTNKSRFFNLLGKASQPVKTSRQVSKHHDNYSEKKTRQDKKKGTLATSLLNRSLGLTRKRNV